MWGKAYWEVPGTSVLSRKIPLGRRGWPCPLEHPQPEVEAKGEVRKEKESRRQGLQTSRCFHGNQMAVRLRAGLLHWGAWRTSCVLNIGGKTSRLDAVSGISGGLCPKGGAASVVNLIQHHAYCGSVWPLCPSTQRPRPHLTWVAFPSRSVSPPWQDKDFLSIPGFLFLGLSLIL